MQNNEILLNTISEIQMGYQSRGKIEENLDGDHKIIRYQDFINDTTLNLDDAMCFTPKLDPKRYLVEKGDILFLARGHRHFAYLLDQVLENTVVGSTFYILRMGGQDQVLGKYLTWWINGDDAQAFFRIGRGAGRMPFVSKRMLGKMKIIVPPIETQKKICSLNDLWQREQNLNNKIIEKKELLIQAVCQEAVYA